MVTHTMNRNKVVNMWLGRRVVKRRGGRCQLHISEYTFLYSCDFQNQVNIPHIKYIKINKVCAWGNPKMESKQKQIWLYFK